MAKNTANMKTSIKFNKNHLYKLQNGTHTTAIKEQTKSPFSVITKISTLPIKDYKGFSAECHMFPHYFEPFSLI